MMNGWMNIELFKAWDFLNFVSNMEEYQEKT